MTIRCYIFDLDGTLADPTHRLHHIQKSPKDWPAFFAAVSKDTPIAHIVELATLLGLDHGEDILFVSGRSDECREATVNWLCRHVFTIDDDRLYMRKAGDHRDDAIVKIEMLSDIRADGYEPIMVFEDRKRVVDAWRAAGIPCAQVAAGDF